MRYVASCSFGKDSVATVILAKIHNEPLDEVVYCEVMFDENTSAEVPEHAKFIHEVAIPTFESWGIKVTVLRAEGKNFIERFNHLVGKGPNIGKRWAWPLCNRCYVQRDLKVRPIEKWKRTIDKNTVQYLGIATDEQERLMRLDGVKKISLLKKYGLTEDDAMQLCRDWGLLSPVYEFTDRGGAFSAPMQRRKSYATCVFSTLLCGFRLSSYKRCLTRQRIGGTEQKLFTILTPAYVKA